MTIKTLAKLTALTGLLAWALPAHAGGYYDLTMNASSATLRVGNLGTNRSDAILVSSGAAVFQSTSATSGYAVVRALNYAGSEILKLTQAGALTVSSFIGNLTGNVTGDVTGSISGPTGNFTATGNTTYSVTTSSGISVGAGGVVASFLQATSKFIGNLTGNVTGNVTGNADTATSLAGGTAGKVPYQSGAAVTAFLPAITSPGSIFGAGANPPSTGTYSAAFALSSSGALTLGVDSSSVVVKSSNLIRNSEIDGSSVTKLNSSGFVPNSLIDGSSITKQGVGISSTCSSGQYLQSMVTTGGVIKGGTCVAAGAGDVTSTGSNSFNTAATNQTFGSSTTFNGGVFSDNKVTNSTAAASLGGALSTAVNFDACASTLTWVGNGEKARIIISGSIGSASNTQFGFYVLMDGAFLDSQTVSSPLQAGWIVAGTGTPFNINHQTKSAPSAASHTFCLRATCSAAACTLPSTSGAYTTVSPDFRIESVH